MAPFLCLFYVQLIHHVLWRDEYNCWAIVCDSHSVAEVLRRVHYEAHPALWYLILYGASQLSHAAWMLKCVQVAVGTAIYLMLALCTPFRRLELAMIFAGYYIFFQYTVLSRMYGLEVLFLLCFVWFRMHRPEWMVRNTVWLGLIANTDITAMILATGLLLEYLVERDRHAGGATKLKQYAASVAVYALLVGLSVATLWPAKDIGWSATGPLFSQFGSVEHFGSAFAKWTGLAFFPQTMDPVNLWFDPQPWPTAAIVPLVLLLFYGVFRTHRRMAMMLIAITVMGILFSQITGVSGIRHIGIGYLAFLAALWMLRYRGETVSKLSYALLGLTVIATMYLVVDQWGRPFADDDAAANWIRQNHLENEPMLGTPDTNVIGVPERLERPLYQLECNCFDRVLTFAHRRDGFDRLTDVPERTLRGMRTLGVPNALLLINRRLTDEEQRALAQGRVAATLLAQFDRGYVPDEHFFVYRLTAG